MTSDPLTRRGFAAIFAAGTGSMLLPASAQLAADVEARQETTSDEGPSWEEVQLSALLSRYPSGHLTEETLAAILRDLRQVRLQSEVLRQFTLDHADAPSFTFRAYRSDLE